MVYQSVPKCTQGCHREYLKGVLPKKIKAATTRINIRSEEMDKKIDKVTSQYSQNPVTMKIERVACYVRVSTQEQKLHGLSLDAQKANLTKYAKEHNMKIVEWYLDEGVSGRKLIRNRPELQRMIHDAEKGLFDRILFIKLDRFFRSVAEYHECMKQIAPVLWTTTEEEYDLTTANGRMLVNMKLTIAEMEADQTGERIKIVNEYKVTTGQPLGGSHTLPFGFIVGYDEATKRKAVVHNPDEEHILLDAISHYLIHQSKKKTLIYIHAKYHIGMVYTTLTKLLSSTMLYGEYRGNPSYCQPYIDKATFDRIQEIANRNIKDNTAENRAYIFSGLIRCPHCGTRLKGGTTVQTKKNSVLRYKRYRCAKKRVNETCDFNKVVSENVIERMMLKNIDKYLADAKIHAATIKDTDSVTIPKYNIDDINAAIDRLNYSWQTGKIRTVEQYERDFAELQEQLFAAEAEQENVSIKDFSKIDDILQGDWRSVYDNLDEAHKRAFWRKFIKSIEVNWTTEVKEVTRVNFF